MIDIPCLRADVMPYALRQCSHYVLSGLQSPVGYSRHTLHHKEFPWRAEQSLQILRGRCLSSAAMVILFINVYNMEERSKEVWMLDSGKFKNPASSPCRR